MIDPREVLVNELVKLGVDKIISTTIALDAGSSQCSVNKEYLKDVISDVELMENAYQKVIAFYCGDLTQI